jgi:SPP1 gp7 family putative phage head morphogenesis protein
MATASASDDKRLVPLTEKERRRIARQRFTKSRKAEKWYMRKLAKIGDAIGNIIEGYAPDGVVSNINALTKALNAYADLIEPWARAVSQRMIDEVESRDAKSWFEASREMGHALKKEIRNAPTGAIMAERLEEQVTLIKSLPLEAAQRVHKLTTEGLLESVRAKEVAAEIMRSGHVTKSRAMLIARTEVARTAAALTQARSAYIGVTHYEWLTVGDSDVRTTHRQNNGKIFRFDDPPIAGDRGERANPGEIYNCRCTALPILPSADQF